MTIIVKSFMTINAYVNNIPGQTSVLGELSTWSRTYSKEKGEYQYNDLNGYRLTTFKVLDQATGIESVLPDSLARQAIEMVMACINYATLHIRPYDSVDFKNTLLSSFFGQIGNLSMGEFRDNGSLALPEWLTWTSLSNNNTVMKVWLSDPAFQDQYDDYEIIVIPPVEPVDMMFNDYNLALTAINDRSSSQLSDKIELLKNGNPESYLRFRDFRFYNSLALTQHNKTLWTTLIYGKTGDNIDSIKDALTEYILENSTHTRAEWEVILPDVFKRTEFILFPRWDKISIENLGNNSSLYSSAVDPLEAIAFAKSAIDFYPAAFIETNTSVFPYTYKALSVVAVNGNTNVSGSERLFDLFPDYIPVSSTSADFNRMQEKTRDWVIFIGDLIRQAETLTSFSSVPLNMRKQSRSGILYVSAMFDNINYMVAAKSNDLFNG